MLLRLPRAEFISGFKSLLPKLIPYMLMGPDECKLDLLEWFLPPLFLLRLLRWATEVFTILAPFVGVWLVLGMMGPISSSSDEKELRSSDEF